MSWKVLEEKIVFLFNHLVFLFLSFFSFIFLPFFSFFFFLPFYSSFLFSLFFSFFLLPLFSSSSFFFSFFFIIIIIFKNIFFWIHTQYRFLKLLKEWVERNQVIYMDSQNQWIIQNWNNHIILTKKPGKSTIVENLFWNQTNNSFSPKSITGFKAESFRNGISNSGDFKCIDFPDKGSKTHWNIITSFGFFSNPYHLSSSSQTVFVSNHQISWGFESLFIKF